MILRSVLLVFACMSLLAWMQASVGSDDLKIQREALSEALEQTLLTQLLKKGYTPRNAAIAANGLIDMYAHCLVSKQNETLNSEPEVTAGWLGDEVVVAYKSPCLTEFLNNFAGLP